MRPLQQGALNHPNASSEGVPFSCCFQEQQENVGLSALAFWVETKAIMKYPYTQKAQTTAAIPHAPACGLLTDFLRNKTPLILIII